jgi:hypothetical protein
MVRDRSIVTYKLLLRAPDSALILYGLISVVPAESGALNRTVYVVMDRSKTVSLSVSPYVRNVEQDKWYNHIQDAVDDANPGESLEVMNGTYNDVSVVDKALTIYAKYPGEATFDAYGQNHTFNVTVEGVEIHSLGISNSGDEMLGILSTAGGLNIHDNTFDTEDDAVRIDIQQYAPGTFAYGDFELKDNDVMGSGGFMVQGFFENQDEGSITWGNMNITGNTFDYAGVDGIHIYMTFYNMTNVTATVGDYNISDNVITSYNKGVYIEWRDFEQLHGTTSVHMGELLFEDNYITTVVSEGIKVELRDLMYLYDETSIVMDEWGFYGNTIDAHYESIESYVNGVGERIFGNSSVTLGTVTASGNVIYGGKILFDIYNFGYYMYTTASRWSSTGPATICTATAKRRSGIISS